MLSAEGLDWGLGTGDWENQILVQPHRAGFCGTTGWKGLLGAGVEAGAFDDSKPLAGDARRKYLTAAFGGNLVT